MTIKANPSAVLVCRRTAQARASTLKAQIFSTVDRKSVLENSAFM